MDVSLDSPDGVAFHVTFMNIRSVTVHQQIETLWMVDLDLIQGSRYTAISKNR